MLVSRPQKYSEPDLLDGHERDTLRFVSLTDDRELSVTPPPQGGWTHDVLEAIPLPKDEPWDAFVGSQWIGSSEL